MTTSNDIADQKEVCKKFASAHCNSPDNMKIGIARNLNDGIIPINGLRHPQKGNTTGWYIWAGEWSDDSDFFIPMHVDHVKDLHPVIIRYLGLEPGFRFLTVNDYVDVWKDDALLIT